MSIHSASDGHLGCFDLLVVLNNAAVDVGVQCVYIYTAEDSFVFICKTEVYAQVIIKSLLFYLHDYLVGYVKVVLEAEPFFIAGDSSCHLWHIPLLL